MAPVAAPTQAGAPVAAVVGGSAAAAAQAGALLLPLVQVAGAPAAAAQAGAPLAELLGGADMVGAPAHDTEQELERAFLVQGGASGLVPTSPMSSSCLLR